MRQLNEVEPEVEVVVKKIDGSSEVKAHLDELGISEGSELTVVATEPVHLHVGPISLRAGGVAGKESVVARGWADKVYVEKAGDGAGAGETVPLLRLEAGEKGTVKSIEGGKGFEEWFSELGGVGRRKKMNLKEDGTYAIHLPSLFEKKKEKEKKAGRK